MASPTNNPILESLREVLRLEANALASLESRVGETFVQAVQWIRSCKGHVVTTGIGKSGLVARKVAATFSSTGTPAVFLHPAEALHGDLGMVRSGDLVLAFGKSGESQEILDLIPALRVRGATIVSVVGRLDSRLAKASDLALDASVRQEACPLDLAPTSSAIVALAIGDALAMTLMKLSGFRPQDFALLHPGGQLGRVLSLRVKDVMVPKSEFSALVSTACSFEDVLSELGKNRLGAVLFFDTENRLHGILTEGDVRRLVAKFRGALFDQVVANHINKNPKVVLGDLPSVEALRFMEAGEHPLNLVPVVDATGIVLGVLRLHDLLRITESHRV